MQDRCLKDSECLGLFSNNRIIDTKMSKGTFCTYVPFDEVFFPIKFPGGARLLDVYSCRLLLALPHLVISAARCRGPHLPQHHRTLPRTHRVHHHQHTTPLVNRPLHVVMRYLVCQGGYDYFTCDVIIWE